jgi:uncharacterized coiled-coil protein SlyX
MTTPVTDTVERAASPLRTAPTRRISATATADRATAAAQIAIEEFTRRIESLEAEKISLMGRLVTAEAQAAEKAAVTDSALTAQQATIDQLKAAVEALAAKLEALQTRAAPILPK